MRANGSERQRAVRLNVPVLELARDCLFVGTVLVTHKSGSLGLGSIRCDHGASYEQIPCIGGWALAIHKHDLFWSGAGDGNRTVRSDDGQDRQAFLDFQSGATETVLEQEGRSADVTKAHVFSTTFLRAMRCR